MLKHTRGHMRFARVFLGRTEVPHWFLALGPARMLTRISEHRFTFLVPALVLLLLVARVVQVLTDAFFVAMAVTIMFGLAFATVLTLIVVPVLYACLFRIPAPQH